MVQAKRRRRCGHARSSHQPPPGTDAQRRPEEDRTRPDANHSTGKVDALLPPDHLARTQTVHRAPPEVRRLPARKHLPRRRQNLEHSRDPQERHVILSGVAPSLCEIPAPLRMTTPSATLFVPPMRLLTQLALVIWM